MSVPPVKRKLAAILSADVKGYSRIMQEDEVETVGIHVKGEKPSVERRRLHGLKRSENSLSPGERGLEVGGEERGAFKPDSQASLLGATRSPGGTKGAPETKLRGVRTRYPTESRFMPHLVREG